MWEYKSLFVKAKGSFSGGKFDLENLESQLNELGKEGWELVNALASNVSFGESGYLICLFKRKTNI